MPTSTAILCAARPLRNQAFRCNKPQDDYSVHYTEEERRLGKEGKHLFMPPCKVCGEEDSHKSHNGYGVPELRAMGHHKYEAMQPGDGRPDWPEYFTTIAEAVAQRATCLRAKVGAVIVSQDNRILATGYNGSPTGEPHCLDVGCDVVDGHCQRTQHAEINAVAYAARYGVPIAGSHLYLWISSGATVATVCRECAKVLRAAGVSFDA